MIDSISNAATRGTSLRRTRVLEHVSIPRAQGVRGPAFSMRIPNHNTAAPAVVKIVDGKPTAVRIDGKPRR